MRRFALVCTALLAGSVASADDKSVAKLADDLIGNYDVDGVHAPRLQISHGAVTVGPGSAGISEGFAIGGDEHTVIGTSADGTVAWLAQDRHPVVMCGMGDCKDAAAARKAIAYHYTLLVDHGQPVVFDLADTIADADLAKEKQHKAQPAFPDKADADAAPVVKLFRDALADPKALAAAVSDRKDVVLYGSDASERYAGGATVKKTLAAWGLNMTLRDGVMAGVTSNKAVAWVAANVDAKAKGEKRTTPYHLVVVFEKTGDAWRAVQIHFSY